MGNPGSKTLGLPPAHRAGHPRPCHDGRAKGAVEQLAAGRSLDQAPGPARSAGKEFSSPMAPGIKIMGGRESILNRIQRNISVSGDESGREAAVDQRLTGHPRNTVPERGQQDMAGRVTLLKEILTGQSASLAEVNSLDEVPAEIADYLRQHNLAPELKTGADGPLARLDWQGANLEASCGRADAKTETACSMAFRAAAESGTLILHSGGENPTTLNFMPDNHIIVIHSKDILASYEDGWDSLREAFPDVPPRAVNFVSGPSRTGDIEQTILLGAHGPRRLHVIIVK